MIAGNLASKYVSLSVMSDATLSPFLRKNVCINLEVNTCSCVCVLLTVCTYTIQYTWNMDATVCSEPIHRHFARAHPSGFAKKGAPPMSPRHGSSNVQTTAAFVVASHKLYMQNHAKSYAKSYAKSMFSFLVRGSLNCHYNHPGVDGISPMFNI